MWACCPSVLLSCCPSVLLSSPASWGVQLQPLAAARTAHKQLKRIAVWGSFDPGGKRNVLLSLEWSKTQQEIGVVLFVSSEGFWAVSTNLFGVLRSAWVKDFWCHHSCWNLFLRKTANMWGFVSGILLSPFWLRPGKEADVFKSVQFKHFNPPFLLKIEKSC